MTSLLMLMLGAGHPHYVPLTEAKHLNLMPAAFAQLKRSRLRAIVPSRLPPGWKVSQWRLSDQNPDPTEWSLKITLSGPNRAWICIHSSDDYPELPPAGKAPARVLISNGFWRRAPFFRLGTGEGASFQFPGAIFPDDRYPRYWAAWGSAGTARVGETLVRSVAMVHLPGAPKPLERKS